MDSGSPKWIYQSPTHSIADESDYFAVYEDYKHVASFKKKEDALQYVSFLYFKDKWTIER